MPEPVPPTPPTPSWVALYGHEDLKFRRDNCPGSGPLVIADDPEGSMTRAEKERCPNCLSRPGDRYEEGLASASSTTTVDPRTGATISVQSSSHSGWVSGGCRCCGGSGSLFRIKGAGNG